jgi:hypothetical protein
MGLGRKVFTAGQVLAAADVQGYLQDQAIMVFAGASQRSAAIGTAEAGMHSFRTDGTITEAYNGSAWVSANSLGGTIAGSQVVGTITAGLINATNVVNTLANSTATAYTFASSDNGQTIRFTSASSVVATVGTATGFTAGQRVDVIRDGSGVVTITAGSGVTFAGAGTVATSYTMRQYDAISIMCVGSNDYRIIGNITAV